MKKLLLIIISTTIFSFQTQKEEKKIHFDFTPQETELIYNALGELPAKAVEVLRQKIAIGYQRQMADTTKKK